MGLIFKLYLKSILEIALAIFLFAFGIGFMFFVPVVGIILLVISFVLYVHGDYYKTFSRNYARNIMPVKIINENGDEYGKKVRRRFNEM